MTSFKHLDQTIIKIKGLDDIIKGGEKSARDVAEDFEVTDEAKQAVNDLRDVMLEYAKMKRDIKNYTQAVEEAKQTFMREKNEREDANLLKIFEDKLSNVQSENNDTELYNDKVVEEFTQTVWNQHHGNSSQAGGSNGDEDDEIIEMTQVDGTQFMCPITKTEFIDPVKNTHCGHSYSKVAIVTHIKHMKEKAKCPIPGCSSKVSNDSLVENNILAFELRQKNRK